MAQEITIACPEAHAAALLVAVHNPTGRGDTWVHVGRSVRYDGPTRTLCGRPCYEWSPVEGDALDVVTCTDCRRVLGLGKRTEAQ